MMPGLLNTQTHKYASFFMLLFFKQLTCVLGLQMDQKCIFCIKSLVTVFDVMVGSEALSSLSLSLSLSGVSLYMVSYNVFL